MKDEITPSDEIMVRANELMNQGHSIEGAIKLARVENMKAAAREQNIADGLVKDTRPPSDEIMAEINRWIRENGTEKVELSKKVVKEYESDAFDVTTYSNGIAFSPKGLTINGKDIGEFDSQTVYDNNIVKVKKPTWLAQAVKANDEEVRKAIESYLETNYPDVEVQLTMDDVFFTDPEMERLQQQLNHPFYHRTDQFRDDVKKETLAKAAKKYPEPFNPDSWSTYALAKHAMAENYDQGNYINGLYERAVKLETIILSAIGYLREAQTGREDQMANALGVVISILRDGVHEE